MCTCTSHRSHSVSHLKNPTKKPLPPQFQLPIDRVILTHKLNHKSNLQSLIEAISISQQILLVNACRNYPPTLVQHLSKPPPSPTVNAPYLSPQPPPPKKNKKNKIKIVANTWEKILLIWNPIFELCVVRHNSKSKHQNIYVFKDFKYYVKHSRFNNRHNGEDMYNKAQELSF